MGDLLVSRPQDIFTNEGNGLSFFINPERVLMAKDINGNMIAVSELLPTPASGGNNKDFVKYISTVEIGIEELLYALNNSPAFTVEPLQSWWINQYVYVPSSSSFVFDLLQINIYKLIIVGNGTYGLGETQLTAQNLFFISSTGVTTSSIEDNPLTQIYTIADLGGLTVSEYINALDPAVEFQDVNIAPRLIKITQVGSEADYLFLPVGGIYGLNELQTTDADFQLLNDTPEGQNNIQVPVVYTLSEIGATSWEDDIPTLLAAHIASQNITVGETEIYSFEVRDNPGIESNLVLTSTDWGSITDAESLKLVIDSESGEDSTISNFTLVDGVLSCIIENCTKLYLRAFNITDVTVCSISGLDILNLGINAISNIQASLPDSISNLRLETNQLIDLNGFVFPSNLTLLRLSENNINSLSDFDLSGTITEILDLSNNEINSLTGFIPSAVLNELNVLGNNLTTISDFVIPSQLVFLDVSNNEINTLNGVDLSTGVLTTFYCNNNQITNFTGFVCGDTVQDLAFGFNLITELNELKLGTNVLNVFINNNSLDFLDTFLMTSTLQQLDLSNNNFTTAQYKLSEDWANLQPNGSAILYFSNNPDSPKGTTFEAILTGKGYNVQY